MVQEWFLVRANKEVGPFSVQKLKELADEGKLTAENLVRRSDQETPRKAGTIKGLFAEQAEEPRTPEPKPRVSEGDEPRTQGPKSKISKKTVIILAVAASAMLLLCCGGMGLMAVFGDKQAKAARAEFAEAEGLWDKGDKAGGAAKYDKIVNDGNDHWLKDGERPRLYGRLVDYRYEKGDAASAKALIEKANKAGVEPAANHPDAKIAIAAVKAEKKAKEPKETQVAKKKSKYTRDEFKSLVIGKSKSEVLDLLGKPATTQELGDLGEYWYYNRLTVDPVTDKTDNIAQITFQGGRANSILFS